LALASVANDCGQGAQGAEHAQRALAYLENDSAGPAGNQLRGEICRVLAQAFLLQERWTEAAAWADRAAALFKTTGFTAGQVRLLAQEYQFFIYHPQQDLRQALRAFQASREMWVQAGNRHEALLALINTAIIYRITGEHEKAERASTEALREADALGFARGRAFALFARAQVQRDKGEYELALETHHDVIFLARQLDLAQLEAGAQHSLSGLYRRQGNLDAARLHADAALRLADETGVRYFGGQARMNMGLVNWVAGSLARARTYFQEARAIFARWRADYELARVHFYLAGVMLQQRQGSPRPAEAGAEDEELAALVAEGLRLVRANDYRFFFRRERDYVLPVLRWAARQGLQRGYLETVLAVVERAHRERAAGRREQAVTAYREAAALYRGDFLEEYPYDDWLVPERERLREVWLQAQQDLAALLERAGDYHGAAAVLREAVRREPYREELHRRLIQCLLRGGYRAEAVEQYRRCCAMLREEFGVEPAAATRKLLAET
jgi:tetratricopeptide (TPR) repeat protein